MGIILKNIVFKKDRALIKVQVEECLTTEERSQLKHLLYNRYPNIKKHACKNSHGPRFDDCVETTSIPHILEHIILEELTNVASPCKPDPSTPLLSAQDDVEGATSPSFPSRRKGGNAVSDIAQPSVFVAKTSNLGGGVAKIELKYYDDISTLQAINAATSSLNDMLKACRM